MQDKNTNKKIVQDIVPSTRRSIRNVSIEHDKEISASVARIPKPIISVKKPSKKKSKSGKYLLSFIIIFICITIIGIALSLLYSKAVVTITPKTTDFSINGIFTAKLNAQNDELGYEVITVSDTAIQTIVATTGPSIQTKSKATVIIYNNYSTSTQILVAGTRLADPNGLIYRTSSSVNIPGKKIVLGKIVPGSVTATIVADIAGANYNTKVSDLKGDFKIIGYKGTPKYDSFYARLKTDLIGGFSGNKMSISSNIQKSTVSALQASLKDSLITKLKNTVPAGYVLYNNAYNIEYENAEPVTSVNEKNSADITVKGIAYGAIFKSDSLIKYIAGKEIQKFPSNTYTIQGVSQLDFQISNSKDFYAKKGIPMIFNIKGPIVVTGTFSESKLKEELKGISVKSSNVVFAKYTSISNAYALITPFWMRSFPNSIENITIDYKDK